MKKILNAGEKNFRITIIFKDQVVVEKFFREDTAINTVKSMKELFPGLFIGGAVEEKKGKWEVIWTSDLMIKSYNRLKE